MATLLVGDETLSCRRWRRGVLKRAVSHEKMCLRCEKTHMQAAKSHVFCRTADRACLSPLLHSQAFKHMAGLRQECIGIARPLRSSVSIDKRAGSLTQA